MRKFFCLSLIVNFGLLASFVELSLGCCVTLILVFVLFLEFRQVTVVDPFLSSDLSSAHLGLLTATLLIRNLGTKASSTCLEDSLLKFIDTLDKLGSHDQRGFLLNDLL